MCTTDVFFLEAADTTQIFDKCGARNTLDFTS